MSALERAPGLAPGKSGFAIRRLVGFRIARMKKWGDQRDLHPHDGFHRAGCCSYIMVSITTCERKWPKREDMLLMHLEAHDLFSKQSRLAGPVQLPL
jgi:hypothetical protein